MNLMEQHCSCRYEITVNHFKQLSATTANTRWTSLRSPNQIFIDSFVWPSPMHSGRLDRSICSTYSSTSVSSLGFVHWLCCMSITKCCIYFWSIAGECYSLLWLSGWNHTFVLNKRGLLNICGQSSRNRPFFILSCSMKSYLIWSVDWNSQSSAYKSI